MGFSRGTANVSPKDMEHLHPLIAHIAKKGAHFFTNCMNTKGIIAKFPSPERRRQTCAVLKDLHEGTTKWRNKNHNKKLSDLTDYREITLELSDESTAYLAELSEEDVDELVAAIDEEEDKRGILRYIAGLMGLKEEDAPEDTGEAESGAGDVSEEEAEEEQATPAVATLAYQLPIDYQKPVELGQRRWRKHLLPLGKKIEHDGETLDFSRSMLSEMLESWKQKAFDTVYATIGHTKDADKGRGVLRDLFLKEEGNPETDGLYGDFELSEAGEEIIKNNLGQIGTSVGYLPKYPRGDGKTFSNALQHVAFVPTPAVPGLQPWVSVSLSEQANVVDLTQAEFSADNPGKEDGPVEENANVETNEEVETVELSDDAKQAIKLAQERADQALTELATYKELSQKTARELLEQKVERELDEYKLAGVPPAFIDRARPVLLAEASSSEVEVIELSEDGVATKKNVSIAAQTRSMLDFMRGTVDLSEEQGRSDVDPETSSDEAQHQKIVALSQEKGISYREAFQELSSRGEVTL